MLRSITIMKMIKMYKEVKDEVKTCNCQIEQLSSMEKHGWSKNQAVEKKADSKAKDSSKIK